MINIPSGGVSVSEIISVVRDVTNSLNVVAANNDRTILVLKELLETIHDLSEKMSDVKTNDVLLMSKMSDIQQGLFKKCEPCITASEKTVTITEDYLDKLAETHSTVVEGTSILGDLKGFIKEDKEEDKIKKYLLYIIIGLVIINAALVGVKLYNLFL